MRRRMRRTKIGFRKTRTRCCRCRARETGAPAVVRRQAEGPREPSRRRKPWRSLSVHPLGALSWFLAPPNFWYDKLQQREVQLRTPPSRKQKRTRQPNSRALLRARRRRAGFFLTRARARKICDLPSGICDFALEKARSRRACARARRERRGGRARLGGPGGTRDTCGSCGTVGVYGLGE